MKLDDVKHGQCFRFKGQKAIWVLANDGFVTQIIGNRKGCIYDGMNDLDRRIEIVEVAEVK
jgi:hypothetical protein